MRTVVLLMLLLSAFGCATKPTPTPEFAAITRRAGEVAGNISRAREDSKSVQALHFESMSLLDRLDYKTVLLLE